MVYKTPMPELSKVWIISIYKLDPWNHIFELKITVNTYHRSCAPRFFSPALSASGFCRPRYF